MFVPLFALPLAFQLVAAASDGVPRLNVAPSCRGAAESGFIATTGDRLKSCVETEERTREQIVKTWSKFPAADRSFCISSISGFEPTYSELATCLEMKRDLTAAKRTDAATARTETAAKTDAPAPRRKHRRSHRHHRHHHRR